MVRLLERDGLVERSPDPTDGRAYRISLTPRGRRVEPVATEILSELRLRAEQRLGAARASATADALRELMDL